MENCSGAKRPKIIESKKNKSNFGELLNIFSEEENLGKR